MFLMHIRKVKYAEISTQIYNCREKKLLLFLAWWEAHWEHFLTNQNSIKNIAFRQKRRFNWRHYGENNKLQQ